MEQVLWMPADANRVPTGKLLPGLQFYSGNYLDKIGKDVVHFTYRGAVCLETQFFPNAVNKP